MIGQLNGILQEKAPPQILLDVQGVGYEVDVPMSTFYQLPELGSPCRLAIHMVVREDAQLLYGFASRAERETFRQLLKVSGIGPKIALAALSGMNADELAQAIAQDDVARLSRIPGIGKKTAERLILELRGKLSSSEMPLLAAATARVASADDALRHDMLNALLSLGYNEREASAALKSVPASASLSDGIRLALKHLGNL